MSRSLLISRTDLSLSPLQLWNPPTYRILGDSFGPGAQVLRRTFTESQWVPGRFLRAAVADMQIAPLTLQVGGTSGSDLATNLAAVIAAFEQWSYTLTAVHDGLSFSWTCEAADYAPGTKEGALEDIDTQAHETAISLLIPRFPTPLSGPF